MPALSGRTTVHSQLLSPAMPNGMHRKMVTGCFTPPQASSAASNLALMSVMLMMDDGARCSLLQLHGINGRTEQPLQSTWPFGAY